MNRIKATVDYLTGKVYIPEKAFQFKGKRLLHVSDTPASFYPGLKRLLEALKPDYIVHTGDLADNIKLQLYPLAVPRYEKTVKPMLEMLQDTGAEAIYVAIGNHDNLDVVKRYNRRLNLVESQEYVDLGGRQISISHFPKVIGAYPGELNFFGHNLHIKTHQSSEVYYFNGISHLYWIELETMDFVALDYPWGTDDQRLGKGRVGY